MELKINITQNLKTGEIQVQQDGRSSFPITLQLVLAVVKLFKDAVVKNTLEAPKADIKNFFPNGTIPSELAKLTLKELREEVALKAEGEMYDLINLAVSSFLDTEFPRVNAQISLTEVAAQEVNLDSSATVEELVEAENKLILEKPEKVPGTPIRKYDGSVGGPNREQRRKIKKGGPKK